MEAHWGACGGRWSPFAPPHLFLLFLPYSIQLGEAVQSWLQKPFFQRKWIDQSRTVPKAFGFLLKPLEMTIKELLVLGPFLLSTRKFRSKDSRVSQGLASKATVGWTGPAPHSSQVLVEILTPLFALPTTWSSSDMVVKRIRICHSGIRLFWSKGN